jgi:hypothetical protein
MEFFDGMPSDETVRKVYDQLDFSRGVETFLTGCPAASIHAFVQGMKEAGMATFSMGITEQLLDARSLWLTPNTTTVYCIAEINVKDGPTVLEVPPGVLGPVDDAFLRYGSATGGLPLFRLLSPRRLTRIDTRRIITSRLPLRAGERFSFWAINPLTVLTVSSTLMLSTVMNSCRVY